MSGAAGLSAAKRRRGGSASQITPQPPQIREQANVQSKTQMTPMQVLQQHHTRIAKLEESISSKHTDTEGVDTIKQRLDALENSVNSPKENEMKGIDAIDTVEDIEYFKNKTILLGQQIAELKQMMLKIQNFAMETSMSLMKAKNGIDIKEQKPIEPLVMSVSIPITETGSEAENQEQRQQPDILLDKTD